MKTILSQIEAKTLAKLEQDRARVEGRPLSYQQALDVVAKAHGFAHTHEMIAARRSTPQVFQALEGLRRLDGPSIVARSCALNAASFGMLMFWQYGQAFAVLDATMLVPDEVLGLPNGTMASPYSQDVVEMFATASIVFVSGLAQAIPVIQHALIKDIFAKNTIMGVAIPPHVVVVLEQGDLTPALSQRCVCLNFSLADFGTKRRPGDWIALGVQAKRLSKKNATFLSKIPSSDPRTPDQLFHAARLHEIFADGPLAHLCIDPLLNTALSPH